MKRRELLLLAIGVFLTVVAILVVEVYNVRNQTNVKAEGLNVNLKNYKIDLELFKILEQKTE